MGECDAHKLLTVTGKSCILFDDVEKSIEVESCQLLIPWFGDKSVLIDRFDGRGYLTEVYEPHRDSCANYEDSLSEDEIAIEKLCEFERYLELNVDFHEMAIQNEEECKRDFEKHRSQYGAVNFSYPENSKEDDTKLDKPQESVIDEQCDELYIPPPELQFLNHLLLPKTDKQAQVIEKTAVFVARQGNQMEIILKAKQNNNPLFGFLNYDHDLNPFYKEVVNLISQGRYIPKPRQRAEKPVGTLFSPDSSAEKPIDDDSYELKLPKVDISNTAYAALINKFKKVNENAALIAASRSSTVNTNQTSNTSDVNSNSNEMNEFNENVNQISINAQSIKSDNKSMSSLQTTISMCTDDQLESKQLPNKMDIHTSSNTEYERYYQEYYKHYYTHYYQELGKQKLIITDADCSGIVQEAAKAAAIAAAAAMDTIKRTQIQPNLQNPEYVITTEERGIIHKMAEYVVRNGLEFEELVSRQKSKDSRFGFLQSNHSLHSYYMSKRHELDPDDSLTKAADSGFSTSPLPLPLVNGPVEKLQSKSHSNRKCESFRNSQSPNSYTSEKRDGVNGHHHDRQSSVSFRLTRPSSSQNHQSNTPTESSDSIDADRASTSPQSNHFSEIKSKFNGKSGKKQKERSPRPRCIIPGIPSPSSSSNSSSTLSSRASSPCSPYLSPEDSSRSSSSSRLDVEKLDSYPSQISASSMNAISKPSSSSLSTNNHSPKRSTLNSDNRPHLPWGSCKIEDLLDIHEPISILDLSTDSYHTPHTSFNDAYLQLERRKRVAKLVNQLKLTNSITSSVQNKQINNTKSFTSASKPKGLSPPPAPDSVPAAVAHAVVASLKRRQEATYEAEVKARKRQRSPPAAYAVLCNRLSEKKDSLHLERSCSREENRLHQRPKHEKRHHR